MQTVANRITLARILSIPVFIALLASDLPYKQWLAASAFAVIAISDGLDGYLARSLNQVTDFGKMLDPLADKLVIAAALITLIQITDLPVWAAIIIIGREVAVSILRMMAAKKKVVISASALGKTKTVLQITAVFFWIFNIGATITFINFFSWAFIISAVVFSIISAVNYFLKFRIIWMPR